MALARLFIKLNMLISLVEWVHLGLGRNLKCLKQVLRIRNRGMNKRNFKRELLNWRRNRRGQQEGLLKCREDKVSSLEWTIGRKICKICCKKWIMIDKIKNPMIELHLIGTDIYLEKIFRRVTCQFINVIILLSTI